MSQVDNRRPTDAELDGMCWWNRKTEAERDKMLKAARKFRGEHVSAAACYRMYGRKYKATALERRELLERMGFDGAH